jgi:hypothetical protein
MALMTGDAVLADFIAESRCEFLLIPVSLFQSVIVAGRRRAAHIANHRRADENDPADPPKAGGATPGR